MFSSYKVFIYNGLGTSGESASDLKQLLENDSLSIGHPDVTFSDYNFNSSGLNAYKTTFVIPGGSTTIIGSVLKNKFQGFNESIGAHYDYIGICAGGFAGVTDAELFIPSHKIRPDYQYEDPMYFASTRDANANISLSTDYKAIGPFYPTAKISEIKANKLFVPHAVELNLMGTVHPLTALYVSGPAFTTSSSQTMNYVIADYQLDHPVTFKFNKNKTEHYTKLHSIVCSQRTEQHGMRLFSGVHLEASVENSKLLKVFDQEGPKHARLEADEYEKLIKTQPESHATAETILRKAFQKK